MNWTRGSMEEWQSFLLFFAFSLDSRERARDKWIGCNSNAHCFALTRTRRRTRGNVDAFKRDITTCYSCLSVTSVNERETYFIRSPIDSWFSGKWSQQRKIFIRISIEFFNTKILPYKSMNIVRTCEINLIFLILILKKNEIIFSIFFCRNKIRKI